MIFVDAGKTGGGTRTVKGELARLDGRFPPVVAGRQDGGHPRAHGSRADAQRPRALDERNVTDADAGHVGDGIVGADGIGTNGNADFAAPGAVVLASLHGIYLKKRRNASGRRLFSPFSCYQAQISRCACQANEGRS